MEDIYINRVEDLSDNRNIQIYQKMQSAMRKEKAKKAGEEIMFDRGY